MAKVVLGEGVFYVDAYHTYEQFTVPYKVQYDDSNLNLELEFYPAGAGINDDIESRGCVEMSPLYNERRPSGIGASATYAFWCGTYNSDGSHTWGFTHWTWYGAYERSSNTIDFKVEIDDWGMGANVADGFSISWDIPNKPPKCESISASNVYAGATATVRWSISDPNKDTTYTTSLKRYIKAKGSSTWVSSNLSVSSSATLFGDAIPVEYRGGEVYWEVGFRDSYGATGTAKSPTYSLNTAPTGTINVSGEIKAGESVDITWTASDADGDTVSTSQLIRYLKKKGESSYTATTLISNGGVVRSYRDVIPEDAGEGSIYYAVVLSDGSLSTTINSSAQAVERSCSLIGSVNIGGVNREITEAYVFIGGVAREVVGSYANINGVWKPMF